MKWFVSVIASKNRAKRTEQITAMDCQEKYIKYWYIFFYFPPNRCPCKVFVIRFLGVCLAKLKGRQKSRQKGRQKFEKVTQLSDDFEQMDAVLVLNLMV